MVLQSGRPTTFQWFSLALHCEECNTSPSNTLQIQEHQGWDTRIPTVEHHFGMCMSCVCVCVFVGKRERERARDRKLERAVSLISFVRQNRNNLKNILRIYSMTNDIFSHKIADPYFTCRNRHTISFWHRQRLFQVRQYFTLQSYNVKQESLF